MSKTTQERIDFIELLHGAFFKKKGHGAFAYISVTDALELFEQYLRSHDSADLFINRFIRTA